jgi:hypothetical protein
MADRKKKQPRDSTVKATEKVRTEYHRQLARALGLPTDDKHLNSWSALIMMAKMHTKKAKQFDLVIRKLEEAGLDINYA